MALPDPYERAAKIRRGELDDEMPDFESLKAWLARCPKTWVPALLYTIVVKAVVEGVYRDGGLQAQVDRAVRIASEPNSMLRKG